MEKINFQNNVTKANAETMTQFQDNIEKSVCPVGTIVSYAGLTAPNGWLICNGQSLSKNDYLDLFNVIEYIYGGENDNFNIPNLNGKISVGLDTTQTDFNEIGKTGGSKYTERHSHGQYIDNLGTKTPYALADGGGQSVSGRYLGGSYNGYSGSQVMTTEFGTGDAGNLQPYITLNYIIKY